MLAGLLAVVVLAAHGPVIVGGRTWSDRARVTEVVPAQLAALDAVDDGRLPGWWDRAGLGAPLWSEPSLGATYPGWWPAAVAPSHATWLLDVLAVLHVLWAGLGVALLARRLGADDLGALFAGAIFAASGVATGAVVTGAIAGVAHLPWAAWAGDAIGRARDRRGWARGAAALAAAVGAIALSGRLALAADAALIGVAAALARGRGLRRGLAGCAAGLAVAALLAAIALVPAALHLGGDVAEPAAPAPSSWALVELVFPEARALGGAAGAAVLLGGAALLFAVAAVAQSVSGDGRRVLGGVEIALALAGARSTAEHLAAAAVLIAALAGAGWTGLAARRPDRRTWIAVAAAAGALIAAVVAIAAARPVLARDLADAAGGLDEAVARIDHALAHAAIAAAVAVGALALVLAAVRRGVAPAIPAAAVLAVGHAVIVGRLGYPVETRANLDDRPALLDATDGGGHRLYRPLVMGDTEDDPHQTLAGAVPSRFGLVAARWAAPGRQRAEEALWSSSASGGSLMLHRFAIDLAIVPAGVPLAAGKPALGERAGWALMATEPLRARGFVAPAWRWYHDDRDAAAAMFPAPGERGLPLGAVARDGDGDDGGADAVAPVPCEVHDESADQVVVRCDGPAGVLVLLDAWAPGWSVTVDGAPARLERVDLAARGVEVGPGAHVAIFRYAPPGRRLGAWLGLAGLFGLVALLAVGLLPSRRVAPA